MAHKAMTTIITRNSLLEICKAMYYKVKRIQIELSNNNGIMSYFKIRSK